MKTSLASGYSEDYETTFSKYYEKKTVNLDFCDQIINNKQWCKNKQNFRQLLGVLYINILVEKASEGYSRKKKYIHINNYMYIFLLYI